MQRIDPLNTVFVVVSFEGPDAYSMAGGLGARVTEFTGTLANLGFETHLVFVGDPQLPWHESRMGGMLNLYRWCQWISKYYPEGVYQGEQEKSADFSRSLPGFVVDRVAMPAANEGKLVVIMGEEWHTAEAMCNVNDLLSEAGLKDRALPLWNANNTFSFNRIDWSRLSRAATITTVSRYMKLVMRGMGVEALVIPNGIPSSLISPVDIVRTQVLRSALDAEVVFFKMARWDPAKGWLPAVEATAKLRAMGHRVRLVVRGGLEPYGGEVLDRARSLGLRLGEVKCASTSVDDQIKALGESEGADLLNLEFFVPPELARLLYTSADGVLANSRHEPFGLVGLESMAAGGITYTGSTGEEYARPMENAIVLESCDPEEIAAYARYLRDRPDEGDNIRKMARMTARNFTWENIISRNLLPKLEFLAWCKGLLKDDANTSRSQSVVSWEQAPAAMPVHSPAAV